MNAEEMKRIGRGVGRDMSPEAIARRIDIVSRLRAFTRVLGKAEKVGQEKRSDEPKSRRQYDGLHR